MTYKLYITVIDFLLYLYYNPPLSSIEMEILNINNLNESNFALVSIKSAMETTIKYFTDSYTMPLEVSTRLMCKIGTDNAIKELLSYRDWQNIFWNLQVLVGSIQTENGCVGKHYGVLASYYDHDKLKYAYFSPANVGIFDFRVDESMQIKRESDVAVGDTLEEVIQILEEKDLIFFKKGMTYTIFDIEKIDDQLIYQESIYQD